MEGGSQGRHWPASRTPYDKRRLRIGSLTVFGSHLMEGRCWPTFQTSSSDSVRSHDASSNTGSAAGTCNKTISVHFWLRALPGGPIGGDGQ